MFRFISILGFLITFIFIIPIFGCQPVKLRTESSTTPACENPGWFPTNFGLKDHHIFWHDGYSYLISIYVPPDDSSPFVQDRFPTHDQRICANGNNSISYCQSVSPADGTNKPSGHLLSITKMAFTTCTTQA